MEANENNQNKHLKFYCELCDYTCCKKFNWEQHLSTLKHCKANHGLMKANKIYECEKCDIKFNHNSSYCRHKKKCLINNVNPIEEPIQHALYDKELMLMLIKQNAELLEIVKNGTNNTNITNNNNNNNNNNNKTFNLQVFLNETCKDAMNMSEFIETIKIQLTDLEKMGEIGYVQGLSNIINNNLKTLDITQRPVHCTDQKRETIYIKNDNIWEKDDDNKTKLRKAINKIAVKNIKALPQFREKYPDYHNSSLKISDTYDKLVLETMGGVGDEILKESKIIHNISKCITIDSLVKHSA
jgi:hypothetical protein